MDDFQSDTELHKRANEYASRHKMALDVRLGLGTDGVIIATSAQTAIKIFEREVVEMSIVTPPFILDFAKSDLDYTTEFPNTSWKYGDGKRSKSSNITGPRSS